MKTTTPTTDQTVQQVAAKSNKRRWLKILLPVAPLIIFALSIAVVQHISAPKSNAPKTLSPAAYKQSLKSQVDNSDGSPVSGRDPSSMTQTSLAAAAATPSGTGTRTDNVASAVTGTTTAKVNPDQVYSADQQKTGINDAGCFYDYGIPGQQCMPASMAKADGTLDCEGVWMHFPAGIKVSGTDRFHLDTNHDGTACGPGDN